MVPGTKMTSLSGTLALTATTTNTDNSSGQITSITGQVAGITDNQGNAINYSYDSEGRRIGEEVRDPQNILTRYATYGYDDTTLNIREFVWDNL